MKLSSLIIVAATFLFGPFGSAIKRASAEAAVLGSFPPAHQNLVLAAPVKNWDEAVPWATG